MQTVNPKRNKTRGLPEIPDRYEIAEYIEGRLQKSRREEIKELLNSDEPAAKSVRVDYEEIKRHLKSIPSKSASDAARKTLQERVEKILKHTGNPSPGEIWSLQLNKSLTGDSTARPLFIIHVHGQFVRVAPVSREIEFAGPRDIVARDNSYAFVPFMLELFTSFWTDLDLLIENGQFEASISDKILTAARKADRGLFAGLPRGVRRGSSHIVPDVEEFHEEWRERERMLFEKFMTSPHVLEELEISQSGTANQTGPIVIRISSISYQQPTQYVYHEAAADLNFTVSELEFWEKERELSRESKYMILATRAIEVRASPVEGHLFLIVERKGESPETVSNASLIRNGDRIFTNEQFVQFTSSNRVHFHFDIDPKLQLKGRWTLRFRLGDNDYEKEIEFL